jgi:hypothetical protein
MVARTKRRAKVPFGLGIVLACTAGALFLIGRPYRQVRERAAARVAACDRLFVALRDEAAVELGTAVGRRTDGSCNEIDVDGVVRCLVRRHLDDDNPRNRNLRAYTTGPIESCQVRVEADGPGAIRFSQVVVVGAATRTFSVRVE